MKVRAALLLAIPADAISRFAAVRSRRSLVFASSAFQRTETLDGAGVAAYDAELNMQRNEAFQHSAPSALHASPWLRRPLDQ
jgi:hypothetical protein